MNYFTGNEHLHKLTSHGKYSLRIDMSDFKNNHRHAVYNKFFVGSESAGYKLDVTGYSGDAGEINLSNWILILLKHKL